MRRTTLALLLILIVIAGVGLVALTPFALGIFLDGRRDWEALSHIGETYGAASALLSGLALIGVAVTLVLQARETKVSREQGQRALYNELLKMSMDDPVYRACWGPIGSSVDDEKQRQHMYVNRIISGWYTSYELKTLSEPLLRTVAANLFRGDVGRRFWADGREVRLATSDSRRERRFHEIIDEEYRRAVAEGPPVRGDTNRQVPADKKTANSRMTPFSTSLWAPALLRPLGGSRHIGRGHQAADRGAAVARSPIGIYTVRTKEEIWPSVPWDD